MEPELKDALDRLDAQLKGRTIVDAGIDVSESGYHILLDDGNILICVGVVGLYRQVKETIQ
jgi:hypothetical protein